MPSNAATKDFQPLQSKTSRQKIGRFDTDIAKAAPRTHPDQYTSSRGGTIGDKCGSSSSSGFGNNFTPGTHPVSPRTSVVVIPSRSFDSDPLSTLERGEGALEVPEPKEVRNSNGSTTSRDDLSVAVAVPIEKPQDNNEGNQSKQHGPEKEDSRSASTSETQNNSRSSTSATVPPTKKLPSPLSVSFRAGSLQPSPALKFILSILLGVTVLLAMGVIGVLVAKFTMQQQQHHHHHHHHHYTTDGDKF